MKENGVSLKETERKSDTLSEAACTEPSCSEYVFSECVLGITCMSEVLEIIHTHTHRVTHTQSHTIIHNEAGTQKCLERI